MRCKDPDRSVRFARCARSASCKHLPNILEPSLAFLIYKLFFITLGRLGRVLEASWRVLARLGRVLGASWRVLEASWKRLSASWAHLGASWAHLGASWAHLVAPWARLAASWSRLWASWSRLERVKTRPVYDSIF